MKPMKIEFDVGRTVHDQSVRLVGELQMNGTRTWSIHRDPANQRDDSAVIRDLPADVIKRMAEAVGEAK